MREVISSQLLLSLLYASPTVFEAVEQMLLPVLVPAPVPAPDLAVSEGVAAAAFALLAKLEVDGKQKSPSALKVFRYYCMEGLTGPLVARKCSCSLRTVFLRLKFIETRTGTKTAQFRAMSPYLQQLSEDFDSTGAREVYQKMR